MRPSKLGTRPHWVRQLGTNLRVAVLAGLLSLLVTCFAQRAHAGDPYLEWYTVETPHFRIHYHGGLEEHAQQVANMAEVVHQRLVPETGWSPKQTVDIALTDDTDSANGSARVAPSKLIRLLVTAPDDMSSLNDFDDWYLLLLTHEHTHILHIDNATGLPALVNAILGRTYTPNQAQPKWITEGWAVYLESKYTSAGRLRSSLFDMYLRADVLADRIKPLDQISSDPRHWPGGSVWYLYGGEFLAWISETYGEDTLAAVSADYGNNILVWGINRSVRRATGRTYPELWDGFVHHLRRRYAAQMAEVERRGRREGTRLTFRGQTAEHPRFVPACARESGVEAVLYRAADGHSTNGWYRLSLASRDRVRGQPRLEVRTSGNVASYDAECNLIFDDSAPSQREYSFSDLFRQTRGTRSRRGIEGSRDRLTTGRRASHPDVSPDGRQIVYVTNRAGTRTLRIADLTANGQITQERVLVPSASYEQAYTPRFSPDGRHVAYSAWTRGGHRDIRIVEVATGRFVELFHDRAMEQQPTWSGDGLTLFFTSDRTGIPNVYAFDLLTQQLHQVTNVRTGAYMPEVTPDGKTLFYVGYTDAGYDLYSMPLDRAAWLTPVPYVDRRPAQQPTRPQLSYPVRRYRPRETLRPYFYEVELGPGTFGNALNVTTTGTDAAGLHGVAASVTIDTEEGLPSTVLRYDYRKLPFDVNVTASREAAPRRAWEIGDEQPLYVEYTSRLASRIVLPLPRAHDSQSLRLGYSLASVDAKLPVRGLEDPYALVTKEPRRGIYSSVTTGWSYSNLQRSTYGIGTERGVAASLSAEYAGVETGSESSLASLNTKLRAYVPLPWARHHILAGALSGGTATASQFFTGGFVESPLLEAFQEGTTSGAFVLRGYEPAQFGGSQFVLVNTEYRFPIAYVDHGVSTLPVFLRSVAGNFFADYGGAFRRLERDRPLDSLQLGLGMELWFDVTLGYSANGQLRLGYARGTDSDAIDGGEFYLVASAGF